jgi:sialidase-1
VTRDLGRSWETHPSDNQLPEPVCQASLVKVSAAENGLGKDLLFFSNPDSQKSRVRMTLRMSEDLGMTWPHALLLDEEAGWGYSCIAPVDRETVAILYEGSTAQLVFQLVRIRDLMGMEPLQK